MQVFEEITPLKDVEKMAYERKESFLAKKSIYAV